MKYNSDLLISSISRHHDLKSHRELEAEQG